MKIGFEKKLKSMHRVLTILVTGVIVFFCTNVLAQTDTLWTRTYGGSGNDYGYLVQQTSDGGYIIVGYTNSFGAGSDDVYLIKTNANGDTLWARTYGGSKEDYGYSVQQTSDGGYIITGSCSFTSSTDVYLIKVDANGNQQWSRIYGGGSTDVGKSVRQASDGGYIIVGLIPGSGDPRSDLSDVYLIKVDASGNQMWDKIFGGEYRDYGYSVQQTSDGGYIIAGATYSFPGSTYPPDRNVLLIKTNVSGNLSWYKTFGDSSYNVGNSVQQTSDGGYIITGETSSWISNYNDLYLIKTDASGNAIWKKTFGDSGYVAVGNSVKQTNDSGYIIAGNTNSFGAGSNDVYLMKTNASGNALWTRTFGASGSDVGNSVQQTSDGGYIIAGTTNSFGAGGYDVYLVKTRVIGVEEKTASISDKLFLNSQNPFTRNTEIKYGVAKNCYVNISIHNLSGQKVATLVGERKEAGEYKTKWDGKNCGLGIYFVVFKAGGYEQTKKIVLMK
ncbi:MAG: T9SS type A sorting domain-containing protein [bacterium]|nr:T9SS type A sorting domain-containing protein [bacterium]